MKFEVKSLFIRIENMFPDEEINQLYKEGWRLISMTFQSGGYRINSYQESACGYYFVLERKKDVNDEKL